MSDVKRSSAPALAVFIAALLPVFGNAQMQQTGIPQDGSQQTGVRQTGIQQTGVQQTGSEQSGTRDGGPRQQYGIWQSGSATSTDSETVSPSSANRPDAGSTASSWSAGQGSFGFSGAVSGETGGAGGSTGSVAAGNTGSSSWVAGRGSFGSAAQRGGIWRDSSGFSGTTSLRSANSSLKRTSAPFGSPAFKNAIPSFANKTFGAPSHAAVSHLSTSRRPVGGPHLGVSSSAPRASRVSASGRTGTKPISASLHSRTSAQSHSNTGTGFGTNPSGSDPATQTPSVFTPSSPASDESTTGEGTAPVAPQQ